MSTLAAAVAFDDPSKATIRYEPRGGSRQLFKCKDPELLIEGPAGTGKSLGCLQKTHLLALKYPRSRHMLIRKTRVSMRQSVIVTWENKVQPQLNGVRYNKEDSEYRYPNGSIVAVAGLDKASKHMSSEWDTIYGQEATEFTEDDVQDLTTRLRNGIMPYQQLILDCNPGPEKHFLHLRSSENGPMTSILSRHKENPTLWDEDLQQWTTKGVAYMSRLDSLSGVRRLRLRDGLWSSAEGMVYEDFNPIYHVVPSFTVPDNWPLYWSVDFGFTNPFVAQLWTVRPSDGCMFLVKEIYMTHRLVSDHAKAMKAAVHGSRHISAIICDHDAEGRATLEKELGIKTTPAHKAIREGIQAVQERLRIYPNGGVRVAICMDALSELDTFLSDPTTGKSMPTCTRDEIEGYIWDTRNNRRQGEEPLDKDNHGCDALRYMVAYIDKVGVAKVQPDLLVMSFAPGRLAG